MLCDSIQSQNSGYSGTHTLPLPYDSIIYAQSPPHERNETKKQPSGPMAQSGRLDQSFNLQK